MAESAGTAAPSSILKVQGSSRLAIGATTAALVTLASGGTAVLVSHATQGVGSPTALPLGGLPADAATAEAGVVLEAPADPTEHALHAALSRRATPGRRTLTAPLVPIAPPRPALPPAPVVGPPVATPAPVTRPVAPPPPITPTSPPTTAPDSRNSGSGSSGDSLRGPAPDPKQAEQQKKAAHKRAEQRKKAEHKRAEQDRKRAAEQKKADKKRAEQDRKAKHDADRELRGKGRHAR